jgi:hypothetical protein
MRLTLSFAALVSTANFTTAEVIQPRDDRPAFAKPFKLSVWVIIDPKEFTKDGTSEIILTEQLPGSSLMSGSNINSGGIRLSTAFNGSDIARLADINFYQPTVEVRQVWIDDNRKDEHRNVSASPERLQSADSTPWV